MSAATQMVPDAIPEDANASREQTLSFHSETAGNTGQTEIARLAYTLWQQRGCPEGSAEIDWFQAEQQLNR